MTKSPFSFYRIRFCDCDPFGHLNNARYLDYFLSAREDHLKNTYGIRLGDLYEQEMGWYVKSHEINYISPAKCNETICIQSDLLKAGDDFLFVEMQMLDESKAGVKALLWTIFVSVNIKTGKRQKHTAGFMAFAKSVERLDLLDSTTFDNDFWLVPH